jgi:hypothetical protein
MARSNYIKGKTGTAAAAGHLMVGAKKHFPDPKEVITVAGTSMTVGDATSELQKLVDNRTAVVTAQAAAAQRVAAEATQLATLGAFLRAFIAFVRVSFGTNAEALLDFGIEPPKARAQPTTEQMAVAAAKREATRAKRGTTGPKAKKAVHGNIRAELVVTPEQTTAAPTPTATSSATATATPGGGGTTQQH